jgi:drug/metabolite transporter (DMT)-like permease
MNLRIFFAFAAIYVIWGSTYLAILFGISGIPPFLMSAIRFISAGMLLYGWCIYKKGTQATVSDWGKNSICGVLLLFGGTASITWTEQYIPSSVAAIIVGLYPYGSLFSIKCNGNYTFRTISF